MKACRHCKQSKVMRPRGLCWKCYYSDEIKALYPKGSANPATAKYVPLLGQDEPPPSRRLGEPTTAYPGSEGKIAVLAYRVANSLVLFHPGDPRSDAPGEFDRDRIEIYTQRGRTGGSRIGRVNFGAAVRPKKLDLLEDGGYE